MNEKMTYEQFETDWLKRHKGSRIRPPVISSWGLIGGILIWAIIAIGAAVVSGAHSIPAILQTIPQIIVSPLREIFSLFGFTIFEMLIFAGALYRHDTKFATAGLLLSLLGALAANIGSSIFSVHENGGAELDYVVAIVLALIAPLAAFLAGEMVHRLFIDHAKLKNEQMTVYDEKRRELDKVINREFVKYEKAFKTSRNSRNPFMNDGEIPDLHEISRNDFMNSREADRPRETSRNVVKPRVKLHEVARAIHENGDADLSTSEMMNKYSISLGSTTKIREMLKGNDRPIQ